MVPIEDISVIAISLAFLPMDPMFAVGLAFNSIKCLHEDTGKSEACDQIANSNYTL